MSVICINPFLLVAIHGKENLLDINIVVVCLLHYISVKRTTVDFVVP